MTPVDTATLAAHLGRSPAAVRALVRRNVITPIGRWRTGRTGRPTMWFDLDQVDTQIAAARRLDTGPARARN